MNLSRAGIGAYVAAFLSDRESVSSIVCIHNVILHRTAPLHLDENLPPGAVTPSRRLSEAELRRIYSSFDRMISPTRSFVDSSVDLVRTGQELIQIPT